MGAGDRGAECLPPPQVFCWEISIYLLGKERKKKSEEKKENCKRGGGNLWNFYQEKALHPGKKVTGGGRGQKGRVSPQSFAKILSNLLGKERKKKSE